MTFSTRLAIVFGILLPLAETTRRWSTWQESPPAILDDFLIGALLLWGAWAVRGGKVYGGKALAAAWGFTCGIGYVSLFEQIRRSNLGEADPSGLPSIWVVAIKGAGLSLALLAFVLTVRGGPERDHLEERPHQDT